MRLSNSSITLSQQISTYVNKLPNPSKILSQKNDTIKLFHNIIRQIDVWSVVQSYRDSIVNMEINIDDAFMQDYIKEVYFRQWARYACSARDYGYVVLEVTQYEQFKGKIVPTKIEICQPEWFGFNKERELLFYPPNQSEGIPIQKRYPNKFIFINFEPSLINPYGTGLLDSAYWSAVGLNGNFEFLMTFLEEDGRDKWIIEHPASFSETQKTELLQKAIELRNGGVALLPEGTMAKNIPMTTRGASGNLYKDTDEMLRRKIEKLWTGTDLTLQVAGKGGYSSSQSGLEIKEEALAQGKQLVIDLIQQLNTIIAGINNKATPPIKVSMFSPRSINKEEAEVDSIYFQMGMKPNAQFFTSRGYDPRHFEIQTPQQQPIPKADFALQAPQLDGLIDSVDSFKHELAKNAQLGKT